MFQARRLLQFLFPSGRAFSRYTGDVYDRFVAAIGDWSENAIAFANGVFYDLYPDTTTRINDWGRQLGRWPSIYQPAVKQSVEAAWMSTGGQSLQYIEDRLHQAGFGAVHLYDGWINPGLPPYTISSGVQTGIVRTITSTYLPRSGAEASPDGSRFFYWTDIDPAIPTSDFRVVQVDADRPWRFTQPPLTVSVCGDMSLTNNNQAPSGFAWSADGSLFFAAHYDGGNPSVFTFQAPAPFQVAGDGLGAPVLLSNDVLDPAALADGIGFPQGLTFSADGLSLLIGSNNRVHQFTLTTPFDVSTNTYTLFRQLFGGVYDIYFSVNGEYFFQLDGSAKVFHRYDLDTPFDISGLTPGPNTNPFDQELDIDIGTPLPAFAIFSGEVPSGSTLFVGYGATPFPAVGTYVTRFSVGGGEAADPRLYVAESFFGDYQCNDTDVFCGEPDVQCNDLIFDVQPYIANRDLTDRRQPPIPTDRDTFGRWIYVAGETINDVAFVDADRRREFEDLLLQLMPADIWVGLNVEYVPGIPPAAQSQLIALFNADTGVTLSGEDILQWDDLTENANIASAIATGGGRYIQGTSIGHSGIFFNVSGDEQNGGAGLKIANLVGAPYDQATVYVVGIAAEQLTTNGRLLAAAGGVEMSIRSSNQEVNLRVGGTGQTAPLDVSNSVFIARGFFNRTGLDAVKVWRSPNVPPQELIADMGGSVFPPLSGGGEYFIVFGNLTSGQATYSGILNLVAIYEGEISPADEDAIIDHLQTWARWEFPIPTPFPAFENNIETDDFGHIHLSDGLGADPPDFVEVASLF